MSNFDWAYPNTVWFGAGRINDLAKACKILNVKKPLLVTDKDLAKTQMTAKAVDNLIRTWANKRKKLLGLEEY